MIFYKIIISCFIPLITAKVAKFPKMNKVKSSALITLILCIVFSKLFLIKETNIEAYILGSTFIGMGDPAVIKDIEFIIIGIIFFLFMYFLLPFIHGPGGILGFFALTATVLFFKGIKLLKLK